MKSSAQLADFQAYTVSTGPSIASLTSAAAAGCASIASSTGPTRECERPGVPETGGPATGRFAFHHRSSRVASVQIIDRAALDITAQISPRCRSDSVEYRINAAENLRPPCGCRRIVFGRTCRRTAGGRYVVRSTGIARFSARSHSVDRHRPQRALGDQAHQDRVATPATR